MNVAIGKAIELLLVVGAVSAFFFQQRRSLERARAARQDDAKSDHSDAPADDDKESP